MMTVSRIGLSQFIEFAERRQPLTSNPPARVRHAVRAWAGSQRREFPAPVACKIGRRIGPPQRFGV